MAAFVRSPKTRLSMDSPGELEQISFYLGRVYYTYVRLLERILVEMGLDKHLRPGMGNVLFALFEQDDRMISEIADRLKVSRSTMTGMVLRMRKAGLITTRTDRTDARAVRLKLTRLGKSLEPRCRQLARRIDDIICRSLTDRQRNAVKDTLSAMNKSMNKELAEFDELEDDET